MTRETITVMGKKVAYWVRNPEAKPTIVMLHGFRGNHRGLVDIARAIREYRLIVPDLPGYGESEPLDIEHSLMNYAQWLDEFVAALGLRDWTSWSHSYSGSIALIQAAQGEHKPVAMVTVSLAAVRRDLASAVSTLYYRLGQLMPAEMQRRWISSRMVDHATGRWLFMTASTKRRRQLQREAEKSLPLLNARVATEEYMSALDTDLEYYAARVQVPVLIIAGAKDVIVPLGRLAHLVSLMPDGSLNVMEDQGHLAPIERPAATATISTRFVRGVIGCEPRSGS